MKNIMRFEWKSIGLILILSSIFPIEILAKLPAPELIVVQPRYGSPSGMYLKWKAVPGAQKYQFCKKVGLDACGENDKWETVEIHLGRVFGRPDEFETIPGTTYTYRVRAIDANGEPGEPSVSRRNTVTKIWPVTTSSDCTAAESLEMLHGFNQAIEAWSQEFQVLLKYLHQGVDITGEIHLNGECVRSPLGGVIDKVKEPDRRDPVTGQRLKDNSSVSLTFYLNGRLEGLSFGHLESINGNLIEKKSVEPGTCLGYITSTYFGSIENNHVHINYHPGDRDNGNPLEVWNRDQDQYLDPKGNPPEVKDTNSDSYPVRFRKGPNDTAYLLDDGKVYGPVDIVVEACDHQSSFDRWQNPLKIGYYIRKIEGNPVIDVVQSPVSPYLLMDNSIPFFGDLGLKGTSPERMNTLFELDNALKCNFYKNPPGGWPQWFTYIVTNTTGTQGIPDDLDANQCWATDAHKTEASPNGYRDGYETAAINTDAKFPDGTYQVRIRLEDYVHTVSLEEAEELDYKHEVIVDNFLPFIERVMVTSGGETIYDAGWMFETIAGQDRLLWVYDAEPTEVTPGEPLQIRVETSETMQDAVSVTLTGQTITLTSTDSQGLIWEGTLVPSASEDYTLTFQGQDMADNPLLAFSATQPTAFPDLLPKPVPKRNASGDWPAEYDTLRQDASGDTVHQLGALPPPPTWTITTPSTSMCEERGGGVICTFGDGREKSSLQGSVAVLPQDAPDPPLDDPDIPQYVVLHAADQASLVHTGLYRLPDAGLKIVAQPQGEWFGPCTPEDPQEARCQGSDPTAPGHTAPPPDSTDVKTLSWQADTTEDPDRCRIQVTWDSASAQDAVVTLDFQPHTVCDGLSGAESGTLEAEATCTWQETEMINYVWEDAGEVSEPGTGGNRMKKYFPCQGSWSLGWRWVVGSYSYGCVENPDWEQRPADTDLSDQVKAPGEQGFRPRQLTRIQYLDCAWSEREIWQPPIVDENGTFLSEAYFEAARCAGEWHVQVWGWNQCEKLSTYRHWTGVANCWYEQRLGALTVLNDPVTFTLSPNP